MSHVHYVSKGGDRMKFLDGKKSFLGAAVLFVLGGLLALGVIDQKAFEAGAALVGGWAVYGLRDAIKKIE